MGGLRGCPALDPPRPHRFREKSFREPWRAGAAHALSDDSENTPPGYVRGWDACASETPIMREGTTQRIRSVGWDLDGMVAVAAGTSTRVRRWSAVLRAAKIRFTLVECASEGRRGSRKYLEIWVTQENADQARDALRDSRWA